MRVFVLRARRGPTTHDLVSQSYGEPDHFEFASHCVINALFTSKHTREDVEFHLVLEGPGDPPKVITLVSGEIDHLCGYREETIALVVADSLKGSHAVQKDQRVQVGEGIWVARMSFERLVRGLSMKYPTFYLSKKGTDIREIGLTGDSCFLLTDHIPMQKKTIRLLTRLGVQKLNLGPKMIFASHCIALIHNELDRRDL